jgi:phosphatidylserine/phosphatidylglycerophosphate/cardiolipin synthase-like enzyme
MKVKEVIVSLIFKGPDLKWIIPHIYLVSSEEDTVYFISPWIDVHVELVTTWPDNEKCILLIDLAKHFRESKIDSVFLFSKGQEYNELNSRSIKTLSKENFKYDFVDNLHAKAVVGKRLMYMGSANITYSGMNRNEEAVNISYVNNQEVVLKQLIGGDSYWRILRGK